MTVEHTDAIMPMKTNRPANPEKQVRIQQLKLRMDWRVEKPLAWRAPDGRVAFCGMARSARRTKAKGKDAPVKKEAGLPRGRRALRGGFDDGLIRRSARLPLLNYGPSHTRSGRFNPLVVRRSPSVE